MFRTWTHAIDLLECFDFVDNFDLGDGCLDSVLGVFGDLCDIFECSMFVGVVGVRPARLSIADDELCFDRCCFGGGSKSL